MNLAPARAILAALGFLAAGGLPAAPTAGDELLAALQSRLEAGETFDDLLTRLGSLSIRELRALQTDFDRVWPRLRDPYLEAFERSAREQSTGTLGQTIRRTADELREAFHAVRVMPEGPMKNALRDTSWPAVEELRKLLVPDADQILQHAGPRLQKQRRLILDLGRFRDALLEAAISTEPPEAVRKIKTAEAAIAKGLSGLDRRGLRVIEKNHRIARDANLPENERAGIEDANFMRLLVGLSPLELDPSLCAAARDHSKDMATLGFFSHTSPVPGKTSPSDRARRAGTTGGAENIFAGSTDPRAANKGWFFSPGHHRNMFNPGYRRIGLGNHRSHWTQMFGG